MAGDGITARVSAFKLLPRLTSSMGRHLRGSESLRTSTSSLPSILKYVCDGPDATMGHYRRKPYVLQHMSILARPTAKKKPIIFCYLTTRHSAPHTLPKPISFRHGTSKAETTLKYRHLDLPLRRFDPLEALSGPSCTLVRLLDTSECYNAEVDVMLALGCYTAGYL